MLLFKPIPGNLTSKFKLRLQRICLGNRKHESVLCSAISCCWRRYVFIHYLIIWHIRCNMLKLPEIFYLSRWDHWKPSETRWKKKAVRPSAWLAPLTLVRLRQRVLPLQMLRVSVRYITTNQAALHQEENKYWA